MKKNLLLLIQIAVSIGLLGWVFSHPEVQQKTTDVLRSADLRWLAVAWLIAGLEVTFGAIRWRIFLQMLGIKMSFWSVIRIHLIGVFFNAFLIGSIGGDAVKTLILIGRNESKTAALLSTLLDRLCGLAVLLLVGCSVILTNWSFLQTLPITSGLAHSALFALIFTTTSVGITFWLASHGQAGKIPHWFPGRNLLQNACSLYTLFLRQWPRTLLAATASALMLFCFFNVFYFSSRAFGLQLPYPNFLGIMPIIDIYTVMPLSVGGVGVREKLFVIFLGGLFGASQAAAVCVSLAGYLLALSWGLFGLASLPFFRSLLAKGKALQNTNENTVPA